jgi:hypothetical protein
MKERAAGRKSMKKRRDKKAGKGGTLTRRGFAVAGMAGMGMIMASAATPKRLAANVSMKEAEYYTALDAEEKEK